MEVRVVRQHAPVDLPDTLGRVIDIDVFPFLQSQARRVCQIRVKGPAVPLAVLAGIATRRRRLAFTTQRSRTFSTPAAAWVSD